MIELTKTTCEDLETLFVFQTNKYGIWMAAFTSKDPNDKTAYMEKYSKLLTDPTINMLTIKVNDEIAGSVAKFVMENEAEITYWIDRKFWGQGIASAALNDFLEMEQTSPIYARVA